MWTSNFLFPPWDQDTDHRLQRAPQQSSDSCVSFHPHTRSTHPNQPHNRYRPRWRVPPTPHTPFPPPRPPGSPLPGAREFPRSIPTTQTTPTHNRSILNVCSIIQTQYLLLQKVLIVMMQILFLQLITWKLLFYSQFFCYFKIAVPKLSCPFWELLL